MMLTAGMHWRCVRWRPGWCPGGWALARERGGSPAPAAVIRALRKRASGWGQGGAPDWTNDLGPTRGCARSSTGWWPVVQETLPDPLSACTRPGVAPLLWWSGVPRRRRAFRLGLSMRKAPR